MKGRARQSKPVKGFGPVSRSTYRCAFTLIELLPVICVAWVLAAPLLLPPAAGAGGVVTNCTEPALRAAMAGGGTVSFASGGTILLANTITKANGGSGGSGGSGLAEGVFNSGVAGLVNCTIAFNTGSGGGGGGGGSTVGMGDLGFGGAGGNGGSGVGDVEGTCDLTNLPEKPREFEPCVGSYSQEMGLGAATLSLAVQPWPASAK